MRTLKAVITRILSSNRAPVTELAGRARRKSHFGKPAVLPAPALVALLLIFASIRAAHAQPIAGIYALGTDKPGPIPQAILENPNVDGLALRYNWDDLESGDGNFDWSAVDRDLALARKYNKKVSLSVTAGIRTPQWVYSAGAARFTFPWDRPWGFAPCSPQSIPVPWDRIYLSSWTRFVRAFGNRYAGNPAVVAVKVTGVNGPTQEIQLPYAGGAQMPHGGVNCGNTDTISSWVNAGYTPAKVENAWNRILEAFANAFPNQELAMMTSAGAFPPIENDGTVAPRKKSDMKLVHDLMNDGMDHYGSRFVIQNNGLSAARCWRELAAVANRTVVGYQMLWSVSDDPHCRMNGGQRPCDPAIELQNAFQRGAECGGRFYEVYEPDLLNPALAGTVAQAHQRFQSQAR